ncbi:hypothetical protein T265_08295 [Opisthorchis viverrini]|uniref:Phorbol-ester/DAG-type domain-containing protein n=1 Tax=Opisthorchis viverrini TaxID=6198 RepID=A0A074ZKP9_OPIVI|nr:hypothetical protein T265_08295 [Opisthorchis viverrini]KER23935.1 hypothetical protein T265_08295 [Opisthorchis viverrini]
MPPERSTRARILPGCPRLDRVSRQAERVGFEPPRTFRFIENIKLTKTRELRLPDEIHETGGVGRQGVSSSDHRSSSQLMRALTTESSRRIVERGEIAQWLGREYTDRKVRVSNPTRSASRLRLSRLGQPGAVSQPSCNLRVAWQLGTGRVLQLNDFFISPADFISVKYTLNIEMAPNVAYLRLSRPSVENLTSSSVNSGVGNGTGTSSGGVPGAGSSLWTKLPHFSAKMKQKSHGHLLMSRKPKYMVKNHVLQERALEEISYCSVCSDLIWGLSPQSLSCCYCDLNVHQKCRAGVRDVCSREGRKSLSSSIATATKFSPPEVAVPQKVVAGIPPSGSIMQDVAGNSTSDCSCPALGSLALTRSSVGRQNRHE